MQIEGKPSFLFSKRTNGFNSENVVEAQSQGYIYVWILVEGNSIRRGSSDLAWTIVVRFVNRPAGKRVLPSVFSFSLSNTYTHTLLYPFSRHESSSKLTMPISVIRQVGALYRTENLLRKFIAETRDSPFVLVLKTFCNIAIITSRLFLGSYLYLLLKKLPTFSAMIARNSFMLLDLYHVIALVVLSSFIFSVI